MRHLLMDPAFPDLVGGYSVSEVFVSRKMVVVSNDDDPETADELSDPFFTDLCKADIDANRLW